MKTANRSGVGQPKNVTLAARRTKPVERKATFAPWSALEAWPDLPLESPPVDREFVPGFKRVGARLPQRRETLRVCVVDDDRHFHGHLGSLLPPAQGFEFLPACLTGLEALRQVPRLQPDVVLMDIVLRDMNGIDCASQLRNLIPTIPIVMVTNLPTDDHLLLCLFAGASGYVSKMDGATAISEAIKAVVLEGRPALPSAALNQVVDAFRQPNVPAGQRLDLTQAELEVFTFVLLGHSVEDIGVRLGCSPQAAEAILRHIHSKLRADESAAAGFIKWNPCLY